MKQQESSAESAHPATVQPKEPLSGRQHARKEERHTKDGKEHSRLESLKKWIGAVLAVMSLGGGIWGYVKAQAENRERSRAIAEQRANADLEQKSGDYGGAFVSLAHAAKAASEGGVLAKLFGQSTSTQEKIREEQQDVAMAWLRLPSVTDTTENRDEVFAELSAPLLSVLLDDVDSEKGTRKGDLLAHIGWLYILKAFVLKDGTKDPDPPRFFRQALVADPANPYAQTYWAALADYETAAGIAEARQHFAAALTSTRTRGPLREWVRSFQLRQLGHWTGYAEDRAAFWQAVDEMVKAGEPFDPEARETIASRYTPGNDMESLQKNLQQLLAIVPLEDQIGVLRALQKGPPIKGFQSAHYVLVLALALEQAGKPGEALAAWRDAKVNAVGTATYWNTQVDAAITRLEGGAVDGPVR